MATTHWTTILAVAVTTLNLGFVAGIVFGLALLRKIVWFRR